MSDTIIFDCPRCKTVKSTFDVDYKGAYNKPGGYMSENGFVSWSSRGTLLGRCRSCQRGIVIDILRHIQGVSASKVLTSFNNINWQAGAVFPAPTKIVVSNLIPAPVKLAMEEAEQTLAVAPPRVARGQFRIVLDVATKHVMDENPACVADRTSTHPLKLNDRINILAKHHLLTPALKDWAHGVRGITNEDVHGIEPVKLSEAQEIAEITRMILTYLFEMPARVQAAKEAAEAKKATTEVPS